MTVVQVLHTSTQKKILTVGTIKEVLKQAGVVHNS